jgi:hypothetical protein
LAEAGLVVRKGDAPIDLLSYQERQTADYSDFSDKDVRAVFDNIREIRVIRSRLLSPVIQSRRDNHYSLSS